MRYTIGHKVTIKHGTDFAENFNVGGKIATILDFDDEEEFDYLIEIDGINLPPVYVKDDELV